MTESDWIERGVLYVVATPMGNLGDITLRGRELLERVEVLCCEDTRRTQDLLRGLGVKNRPRLIRLDAHASETNLTQAGQALEEDRVVAFVSDAGTPGVSDPGADLVQWCRQNGFNYSPLPGASAVAAFVSVAGFSHSAWTFRGFFPRKNSERLNELEWVLRNNDMRNFIWFESPERILSTVEFWFEAAKKSAILNDARFVFGKEMTKKFERFFDDKIVNLYADFSNQADQKALRGEWCFGLELPLFEDQKNGKDTPGLEYVDALELLVRSGVSGKTIAKELSQTFGVPKNNVYEMALKKLGKKK